MVLVMMLFTVFASSDFWWGALIFGGGLFIAQLLLNYNFSDWVKDLFLVLIHRCESVAHAQLQRAEKLAAIARERIAAAARKAEVWKKS